MVMATTITIKNSIEHYHIKGKSDIDNYLAFARWICGVTFNGKIYEIDDVKQICEAYKLYDYSLNRTGKVKLKNNKI